MAETGTSGKIKEGIKITGSLKNIWGTTAGFRGVFFTGVIFDILSSIPWVGLIFSGLGYGSIWLYLEMKGVSASLFGSTKRMAASGAEMVAGAVGWGIVPGISFWTYYCIAEHKSELASQQKKELRLVKSAKDRQSNQQKSRNTSAYMKDNPKVRKMKDAA